MGVRLALPKAMVADTHYTSFATGKYLVKLNLALLDLFLVALR